MRRLIFSAALALGFLGLGQANLAAEPRVALVIGNSAYRETPLANPVNDARLMTETLRALGFEVIELIDADQKTMKLAIVEFGERLDKAGKDAVGLFFYAGHGLQVNGVNYLVPLGAKIDKESHVAIEAVSAGWVLGEMEYASNRTNVVILDACRNNPLTRRFRSPARGLARMDAPRGSLIAYSTAPGQVSRDGEGLNSPYTAALAKALLMQGVPVEQMFKQVRIAVMAKTNDQQVPWESSSMTGDFYFFPGEGTETAAVTPPPDLTSIVNRVAIEVAFWKSIEKSEDPADFEAYLDKYGRAGAFTILARNRIRALAERRATRSADRDAPYKSDEQLAAETLVNAKRMLIELAENAEFLMGSSDVPKIERLEKFRGMLGYVVDFEPMARFVLGRYKNDIAPQQWEDFLLLYREMFLTGYSFSSAKSWAGKYEVKGIRPYGPDLLVTVEFFDVRGADPVVGFRVRRKVDSYFGFKIIDALTLGISLLVTQKDEFAPILQTRGVAGLIEALEDKFGKVVKPIEIPG